MQLSDEVAVLAVLGVLSRKEAYYREAPVLDHSFGNPLPGSGRPVWARLWAGQGSGGDGPVGPSAPWEQRPGVATDASLSSCSIAAVRLADGVTFVVYEFWETEEEWKR